MVLFGSFLYQNSVTVLSTPFLIFYVVLFQFFRLVITALLPRGIPDGWRMVPIASISVPAIIYIVSNWNFTNKGVWILIVNCIYIKTTYRGRLWNKKSLPYPYALDEPERISIQHLTSITFNPAVGLATTLPVIHGEYNVSVTDYTTMCLVHDYIALVTFWQWLTNIRIAKYLSWNKTD